MESSDESDMIEDESDSALRRIESSRDRIHSLLANLKRDVGTIDMTPRVHIPEEISLVLENTRPRRPERLHEMVNTLVQSYFETPQDSDPLLADITRLDKILIERERSAALTYKRLKEESKPSVTRQSQPKPEPPPSKPSRVSTARSQISLQRLAEPEELEEIAAIDRRLNLFNPKPTASTRSLKAIDADLDKLNALPVYALPVPKSARALEAPVVHAIEDANAFDEINNLLDEAEAELAKFPETEKEETDSIRDELAELSSAVNEVLNAIG